MIDIDKKYRTRNGLEVRIYAVDCGGDYPVHGAVLEDDETWAIFNWTNDGFLFIYEGASGYDLIEYEPKLIDLKDEIQKEIDRDHFYRFTKEGKNFAQADCVEFLNDSDFPVLLIDVGDHYSAIHLYGTLDEILTRGQIIIDALNEENGE